MVDVVQLKAEQIDRLNEAVAAFLRGPGNRSIDITPSKRGVKVMLFDIDRSQPKLGEAESTHFVDALAGALQAQVKP